MCFHTRLRCGKRNTLLSTAFHLPSGPMSLDFYVATKDCSSDCFLGSSLPWLMMKLTDHVVKFIWKQLEDIRPALPVSL